MGTDNNVRSTDVSKQPKTVLMRSIGSTLLKLNFLGQISISPGALKHRAETVLMEVASNEIPAGRFTGWTAGPPSAEEAVTKLVGESRRWDKQRSSRIAAKGGSPQLQLWEAVSGKF
jgi:hypothetical protein